MARLGLGLRLGLRSGGGAAAPGTTATHGSVDVTIDGSYTTGNYADGPAYVVIPSGTANITAITPAQTTNGGLVVNGAELNPSAANADQGYDEREVASWNATRTASYPLSVTAGDVVVKSIQEATYVQQRDGIISEWAACFIVASAPAANSFSPAACGWTGRGTPTSYVIDVASIVSGYSSHDVSGHTYDPTYTEIMERLDHFNPIFGQYPNWEFYQAFFPADSAGTNTNEENYGLYQAGVFQAAAQALISTGFTDPQKAAMLTPLISHGKQWYDTMEGNSESIPIDGGHFNFHIVPMALYLKYSGQTAKLATLITDRVGNYAQVFEITSTRLAQMARHTNAAYPSPWHDRAISAVSGLNISVPAIGSEPYHNDYEGLVLTRPSDGATATVTATVTDFGSTLVYTIDAQPTPAFAVSDVVFFETQFPRSVGDVEWGLTGYNAKYIPNPKAPYRNLNKWSGALLALLHLDAWPTDANHVRQYIEDANQANIPDVSYDHPSHHAVFYTLAGIKKEWDAEFWASHAAAILAATPDTVPFAFTLGQWDLNDTGDGGTLAVVLSELPNNGGSPLTDIEYKVDAGVWTSTGGLADFEITGLTDDTSYSVLIRAVNAIGNADDSDSKSQTPTTSVGTTFSEDWSLYSIGNTFTDIDPEYTRSSTSVTATIEAGLLCKAGVTSNNHYYWGRDDIATALAGAWTTVQTLTKFELTGTANHKRGMGHNKATNDFSGWRVSYNTMRIMAEQDPGSPTTEVSLSGTITDNTPYWCRMEINGLTIKARWWADGDTEPATWTTLTHSGTVPFANFGFMGDVGADSFKIYSYSVGIDTTAP